jgi:hypothetical protein
VRARRTKTIRKAPCAAGWLSLPMDGSSPGA